MKLRISFVPETESTITPASASPPPASTITPASPPEDSLPPPPVTRMRWSSGTILGRRQQIDKALRSAGLALRDHHLRRTRDVIEPLHEWLLKMSFEQRTLLLKGLVPIRYDYISDPRLKAQIDNLNGWIQ